MIIILTIKNQFKIQKVSITHNIEVTRIRKETCNIPKDARATFQCGQSIRKKKLDNF